MDGRVELLVYTDLPAHDQEALRQAGYEVEWIDLGEDGGYFHIYWGA